MALLREHGRGFTLVEMMVSLAILSLLLVLLASMTDATRRAWTYTTTRVEQFRDAREAFESITRKLSQATLNTYWDYHYPNNNTTLPPDSYIRQSELRFITGQAASLLPATMKDANGNPVTTTTHAVFFQAPLGSVNPPGSQDFRNLESLLNTCGYFIGFGSDKASWLTFLQSMASPPAPQERYRFRLMELLEPSDSLTLYNYTSGTNGSGISKNSTYAGHEWFTTPISAASPPVRVVAENIVAMVILPRLTPQEDSTGSLLAPVYDYDSTVIKSNAAIDSKNQLPPVLQVTMVAVDESSYNRFQSTQGSNSMPASLGLAALFQTTGDTANSSNPGYAQDLQTLQSTLQSKKINYRVFTTNISIKAAKWSRDQTN